MTGVAAAPYRDATMLAKVAIGLIGFTAAMAALTGLSFIQAQSILDPVNAGTAEERIADWDRMLQSLTGAYYLGLGVSSIAFWTWLYRATRNVPSLGGGATKFTPGWAVGWWFVPFANLAMGFQTVADLWRTMAPSVARQGTALVAGWWLLFLGTNFGMRAASAASPTEVADVKTLFLASAVLLLAHAGSGLLLMRVIWTIAGWARLRAAAVTAPAPWVVTTTSAAPAAWTPSQEVTGARPTPAATPASPFAPPPPPPPAWIQPDVVGSCAACGGAIRAGVAQCPNCGHGQGGTHARPG